ncbi:MAG: AIR synthase-related protein, partial [Dehalococcoidia bacterium]|nr:AIR synthase-related protein [Dehalococcoidia bacterium]
VDGRLLRRSAARPGDLLAVTGHLGNAAGGLKILKGEAHLPAEIASFFLDAHLRPRARVAEGQALVSLGVQAAIDVSDGLLADAGHLCQESGVAAVIQAAALPIHPHLRQAFPQDYLQMAASGGEDYELLFAAPEAIIERAGEALSLPVTVIGRVLSGPPGQVTFIDEDGSPIELAERGWEHFRVRR